MEPGKTEQGAWRSLIGSSWNVTIHLERGLLKVFLKKVLKGKVVTISCVGIVIVVCHENNNGLNVKRRRRSGWNRKKFVTVRKVLSERRGQEDKIREEDSNCPSRHYYKWKRKTTVSATVCGLLKHRRGHGGEKQTEGCLKHPKLFFFNVFLFGLRSNHSDGAHIYPRENYFDISPKLY